jgi:hypothetical protein
MQEGYIYCRFSGEYRIEITPLTFGRARILLSNKDDYISILNSW